MGDSIATRAGAKLAHVLRQIDALRTNERVVKRLGGFDRFVRTSEIEFQAARAANLTWAGRAEAPAIETKLAQLTASLSPEERACKYGIVSGLTEESVLTIAMIEDLEVALGVHPGCRE